MNEDQHALSAFGRSSSHVSETYGLAATGREDEQWRPSPRAIRSPQAFDCRLLVRPKRQRQRKPPSTQP